MDLNVPTNTGNLTIDIDFGEAVIFVGANGSGKSRLAINIEESLGEQAHRISAHRALNLNPDVPKVREDTALRTLRYGSDWDGISINNRNQYRWQSKASSFLLNDFDSVIQALFAEQSKTALGSHNILMGNAVGEPTKTKIEKLNEIWKKLIPHRNLVIDGDDIQVIIPDSDSTYSSSDMSDGERAIFYLIGQVLVAATSSVLIIDEPELHIHRSIMSSLWDQLESTRQDCAFIFITHDIEFAANRIAKKIAINDYQPNGPTWELEEIPEETGFSEELVTLILGSRRPILFVEGDDDSLDKALYRSIYPGWTVIPRGSCQDVIHAVVTLRANQTLTRVKCAGIVDADGHSNEEVEAFNELGIKVLPVSEIENVFLIPSVSREIAIKENYPEDEIIRKLDTILSDVITLINQGSNFENSIRMYCQRRIDRYLKRVDISASNSIIEMKELYHEKTNSLDVELIYNTHASNLSSAIQERNISKILSIFDNKGMLAKAGLILTGKSKNQFKNWLIRTLTSEPDSEIVRAVRTALPEIRL
ncbi:MAG TPA: ABC transporter ATP-binding protein [Providencia sp.]|nr:ABC transporter ATP-binding protein [Providencia sp.]